MHLKTVLNCVVMGCAALVVSACAVVKTTADVAVAGANVVGTTVSATASVAKTTADIGLKTVSTAATIGSASVSAASATVSAAAAAKTATVAAYGVAVAGGALVVDAVKWGADFSRSDDVDFKPVRMIAVNRFSSDDGREVSTLGCDAHTTNQAGALVMNRRGEYSVRTRSAEAAYECKVLTIESFSISK